MCTASCKIINYTKITQELQNSLWTIFWSPVTMSSLGFVCDNFKEQAHSARHALSFSSLSTIYWHTNLHFDFAESFCWNHVFAAQINGHIWFVHRCWSVYLCFVKRTIYSFGYLTDMHELQIWIGYSFRCLDFGLFFTGRRYRCNARVHHRDNFTENHLCRHHSWNISNLCAIIVEGHKSAQEIYSAPADTRCAYNQSPDRLFSKW